MGEFEEAIEVKDKAAKDLDQAMEELAKSIKYFLRNTEKIILSPERFLHLRALVNAFAVADEFDAKSATLAVDGLGWIEWEQGGDVKISIDRSATMEGQDAKEESGS